MQDRSISLGRLPRTLALELENLCSRFEGEWQAGRRPRLEDYVVADRSAYPVLLRELILLDIHYRRLAGETSSTAEYAGRFPGVAATWLREHAAYPADVAPMPASAVTNDPDETLSHSPPDKTAPPDQDVPGAGSRPTFPAYEILDVLGRGGMGVVYKAREVKLKRTVALKMILAGAHAGEQELARFKAEAEAIARLQHPNIVQIYEVGEHDDMPFISLEFCPGGSLDKKLAGTPLPPENAAQLVQTLARAMHAAHQASVIHRDLKPANILLTSDGTPKVTDFGLAKKLDDADLTKSGAIMGTPSYMAPEQAGGKSKDLGPNIDIYALGAILYELLTGRPPFKAATPLDTILQVLNDEPVPPTQLQSRTPRDLETICLKCLRKEPLKRYVSAADLADELGRYLRGEPILARPVGRMERTLKWVRRNRVVSAMMTAIVVLFVVGSTGIYVKYQDAKEQEALAKKNEKAAVDHGKEAEKQTKIAKVNENTANEALREKDKALKKAEDKQEELTYNLALDNILLAQAAFDSGNARVARERLEQVPVELRRWEWHYLSRQYRGGIFTLYGHTIAAYSPDGTHIVSIDRNRTTATIWDARTGTPQLELKAQTSRFGRLNCLAFSPDGTRLVTASLDNTAKVWNVGTGTILFELKGPGAVWSVAFSPDGTRLVTGSSDKVAKIWDARTGTLLFELKGHAGGVRSVAFSPDGTRLVTGGDTAKVWDAHTGTSLLELRGPKFGFVGVNCAAFSPDGERLVTGHYDNLSSPPAKVWDARTGEPLLEFKGHFGGVFGAAYSPDGTRIVTGNGNGMVTIWDARTGRPQFNLDGHTAAVGHVVFSPDGMRLLTSCGVLAGLASGSDDTVKVWDARTGTPQLKIVTRSLVGPLAFSSDGMRLISGAGAGAWDVHSGATAPESRLSGRELGSVEFSDETRLVIVDLTAKTASVRDSRSGMFLFDLEGHFNDVKKRVAFSLHGTRLVTVSDKNTVKVWDGRSGRFLLELKGQSEVSSVALSPDGTRLVSGGADRTVKVWDARDGTPLLEVKGHAYPVRSVTFSPDGTRAVSAGSVFTGGGDKGAKVWDVRTGTPLLELKGHTKGINSVAFSPDGTRLVTGSASGALQTYENTMIVWDARTTSTPLVLKGHTDRVASVAFSPDGTRLVTGSYDKTAKVWDIRTGISLFDLKGHIGPITSVAFSTDGARVYASTYDQAAKLWSTKVWDAITGQDPGDRTSRPIFIQRATSADGRYLAHCEGNFVLIISLDLSPEEQEYRRFWTRPRPDLHQEDYAKAIQAKDTFAARFHLDRSGIFDKDIRVRLESAWVIGKVEAHNPAVVSVLIEAFRQKDPSIRYRAVQIVGNIRPRDEAVLQALRDAAGKMWAQVEAMLKRADQKAR